MEKVFQEATVNGRRFAILLDDETMEAFEAVWIEDNSFADGGYWETDFSYAHIGVDPSDVAGELDFFKVRQMGYKFVD